MKNITKTKKITILALFVGIGLVLQYIEGQILITNVPGGKLGLCNIVSIINIFLFGGRNALMIAALRSLLGSLIFGGAMTVLYSLTGAILSTFAMWVVKRYLYPRIGFVGISIIGAACHNVSQLAVAALLYNTAYVFSYLPMLLALSLISGFVTGCATHILILRMKGTIL